MTHSSIFQETNHTGKRMKQDQGIESVVHKASALEGMGRAGFWGNCDRPADQQVSLSDLCSPCLLEEALVLTRLPMKVPHWFSVCSPPTGDSGNWDDLTVRTS